MRQPIIFFFYYYLFNLKSGGPGIPDRINDRGSNGSTVERPNQSSGAYIMRPDCPEDTTEACKPESLGGDGDYTASLHLVKTPMGMEVHQSFSDWVTQIVRLEAQKDYAQIEYTVGPIPIEDGIGKEVVQVWSKAALFVMTVERSILVRTLLSNNQLEKRVIASF